MKIGFLQQMQWMVKFIVTNGTYSIVSSNSSVPLFVGYGTSNPQYTLDIQGDVSISNSIYNNGTPFSGGGGGSGIVYWTLNSLNSNIYYLLGNVGIGSTIPRNHWILIKYLYQIQPSLLLVKLILFKMFPLNLRIRLYKCVMEHNP